MLIAKEICFKRNNRNILNDINLTAGSNKIIYINGNNGVGKTTLLKILTNVLEPDSGEVFWNSKNIKKNPFNLFKDLTFIMDKKTSNGLLTVNENILFWKKIFSSTITQKEVQSMLNLLLLNQYVNTQVNNLSYGETKKLEISRLIIENKKLWILDEPYIGLDENTVEILNQTILKHVEMDGIVIFTSHIYPKIQGIDIITLEQNG